MATDFGPPAEPPEGLTERSQKLWRAVVFPGCAEGRLASVHSALKSLDMADKAAAILDRDGLTTTNADTKVVHAHPLTKVEKDSRATFHRIWEQLGLNQFATPKPYGR
ncbi:MAG: hypothetical protein NTW75_00015 [Planctomycetales bacterium]|nr:hypothetical protein [Planctomycetales bacterium]